MYLPIDPTRPALLDSFLGSREDRTPPAPQVSWLARSTESVVSSALVYNPLGPPVENYNINYQRSLQLQCLSDLPLKLRLSTPETVDLELYIDSYSYIQEAPVVLEVAPTSPWEIPWGTGAAGFYTRSTTLYIFQGVAVKEASKKLWDARWELVVRSDGTVVPSVDSKAKIRAAVRAALESPELQPSYTVGLSGLANTSQEPPLDANRGTYDSKLTQFIETNWSSEGIPPEPAAVTEVLATYVVLDKTLAAAGAAENEAVSAARQRADQLAGTRNVGNSLVFKGRRTLKQFLGADDSQETEVLEAQAEYERLLTASNVISPFDPPQPLVYDEIAEKLLSSESFSAKLPGGFVGSLAALVRGESDAWFQEWVFYIRRDPDAPRNSNLPASRS